MELERLEVSQGPAEESPWVRFLDHHYLEAEAALVHCDLGEATQAEHLAMASVEANSDRRRRQAISRSVLATAFLLQNRLDEAVGTASNAVDLLAGDVAHGGQSPSGPPPGSGRTCPGSCRTTSCRTTPSSPPSPRAGPSQPWTTAMPSATSRVTTTKTNSR